jgi:hypothetical protein
MGSSNLGRLLGQLRVVKDSVGVHEKADLARRQQLKTEDHMVKRRKKVHLNGRGKRRTFRRGRNRLSTRRAPRTAKQYFATSRQFQELWDHIVQVPATMRSSKVSLRSASRELGVRPRQVLKLAGSAFRRLPNGRYVAKPTDRLLRILVIPTRKGLIEIAVRDSGEASLVGKYWNAVHRYLSTGDASKLHSFRKKRVKEASGKHILLLTDLDELGRQASAGALRFESVYGRAA